jgi:4-aminobutyrate aminotransferase
MTAADLPTPAHRAKVIQEAFQRGLLLLGCGETALRFCPALCVTSEQIDNCLRVLDGVLGSVEPAKPHPPTTPAGGPVPVLG